MITADSRDHNVVAGTTSNKEETEAGSFFTCITCRVRVMRIYGTRGTNTCRDCWDRDSVKIRNLTANGIA